MPVSIEELRPYLQAFDFPRLFVEGMGWNHYVTEPFVVRVSDRDYTLNPIAEKAGFAVYECDSSIDKNVPQYPVRRKIESEVAKRTFEHLIIFTDPGRKAQVWQWLRRESGKPAACREQAFLSGQSGEPVLQRLQSVVFTLDDEAKGIGISDVASRVRKAFDVEKVTKRFYERFRTELTAFGNFIEGITAQGDRDWYASLMLNRMMFVYFVQKQGFLDENTNYLRSKLLEVQSRYGDGHFQQFYRDFMLKLFHHGLGQPEAKRDSELAALLGRVPFLNGGLFDVHDLEKDNPDISIPDAAFERVFNFFDDYRWHLDERPGQADNEINPDVLGYIFEKYVNQKQMGAYYTKEDITGYISRNTVIPFLFDAARKECSVAFEPDGGVWRLLRDDPDRYIYPAVGHGIAWKRAATRRLQASRCALRPAQRHRRGHRRRVQARRLERLCDGGPRAAHRDLARGRPATHLLRRGPGQARLRRGAGDQRPHHAEPRHRAVRQGRHRPERGAGAPARLLARPLRQPGTYPDRNLCPRPHMRFRRVPLRRPQHFGTSLHRLPGGYARLPG